MLLTWDKGVQLFFVISGYILALPFASYALKGGKKISLRSFYLRRVTRLEPPYLLAMILMFVLLVLKGRYSVAALFPSLLASLTYTHNIIFGPPLIAVVTWSLEVEIQFYLVAPFISKIFFLEKSTRRAILTACILLMPVIQSFVHFQTVTIFNFIQYFLAGLLLADLFVSNKNFIRIKNKWVNVLMGALLLAAILTINLQAGVVNRVVFLTCVFFFYELVIFNSFWKKLFSIPVVAIIGGMCYSMYLWHFTIISFLGNYLMQFTGHYSYSTGLFIFCMPLGLCILGFTALYFYFIEKPCMEKNWHKNLQKKVLILLSKR